MLLSIIVLYLRFAANRAELSISFTMAIVLRIIHDMYQKLPLKYKLPSLTITIILATSIIASIKGNYDIHNATNTPTTVHGPSDLKITGRTIFLDKGVLIIEADSNNLVFIYNEQIKKVIFAKKKWYQTIF